MNHQSVDLELKWGCSNDAMNGVVCDIMNRIKTTVFENKWNHSVDFHIDRV